MTWAALSTRDRKHAWLYFQPASLRQQQLAASALGKVKTCIDVVIISASKHQIKRRS